MLLLFVIISSLSRALCTPEWPQRNDVFEYPKFKFSLQDVPDPQPVRMIKPWQIALIFVKIILLLFLLVRCCKRCDRHNGNQRLPDVTIMPAPVIITSSTTTSAQGAYPVAVGGVQASPYHGHTAVPMPMPPPMTNPPYPTYGGAMPQPYNPNQGFAANPPYPITDPSRVNPPSYDQVISAEATQKQAPYNPNYMGN